ncbi:MAG: hypothetical protein M3R02_12465 [Chloroflexota bacterium]|nr:hypothetical protein [Chloroflexota bacterium]
MPVSHRPHPQSTPNVNNIPIRELIVQITSLEMWRIDLWVATPGSVIYGLPAEAVEGFVSDHLSTLRAELRRREGIVEVGR